MTVAENSSRRKAGAADQAKKTEKIKFKEVTGFDLFYQLMYMSAVAASGIDRRTIFRLASRLPRQTAAYFQKVHLLSQKLGYDYSDSTRLVGERVKSEEMRSLLLRFSDALSAGKPEEQFLAEEAEFQAEAYEKEYERDLEALKKWTDGYGALIISSSLIIIVNLISILIYPVPSSTVLTLVGVSIFTSGGGAWILYRSGPTERRALYQEDGPPLQRWTRQAALYGVIGGVLAAGLAFLIGLGLGYALVFGGVALLPAGIFSFLAGSEVSKKDKEFGFFLRSLGGFASATGTTISESLTRLDLNPYPHIRKDIERLRDRMKASIAPDICWKRFSEEIGSRLVLETTTLFNDAISLGGAADTVALVAARYAALTNVLRDRRVGVSGTFTMLTIVMHAVLAALMVIILEVIRNFSIVIAESMAQATAAIEASSVPLPAFGSPELGVLQVAAVVMIVLLAIINALAIVVTDGEHMIKTTLYMAVLFILSGLSFIVIPPFVAGMLEI